MGNRTGKAGFRLGLLYTRVMKQDSRKLKAVKNARRYHRHDLQASTLRS